MFPFSQPVNPVLRSHLDSQLAFFNDLSTSLSGSFQSICEANLKLGRSMLEETLGASQRMLATRSAVDAFGAVTSSAQPASDTLRSYQQHISRLAADAQVDLARVTQQHGEETGRTAHALADEVTRVVTEESERNTRQKDDFLKQFRDPFQQEAAQQANEGGRAGKSAPAAAANMQPTQPVPQAGDKQPGNK